MSKATRAEWAKRVERWRDSGLSAKEFASQTGLNASTLTYWSWKLRAGAAIVRPADSGGSDGVAAPRKPSRGKKNVPRFVEVCAASSPASGMPLELVLSRGICLRVPPGFDEATLVRVMRAVEAAQ